MFNLLTLRDVPATERPRERLVKYGPLTLSNVELLALILGRGTSGGPVMTLAAELLTRFGSLSGLAQASVQDLMAIKGIGQAKACQLIAVSQMAVRLQQEDSDTHTSNRPKICDPKQVAELVRRTLRHQHREHYMLLSLDVRRRLIGIDIISEGILDAALVHPRETFEVAIKRHASVVIVAHNHPSGNAEPSDDDVAITKRLATAGKIMGVNLVDHVIVTERGFASLKQLGLM